MAKVSNLRPKNKHRANVVLAVVALTDVIADAMDVVNDNCAGLTDEELTTLARALDRCYDALADCRPRLVG